MRSWYLVHTVNPTATFGIKTLMLLQDSSVEILSGLRTGVDRDSSVGILSGLRTGVDRDSSVGILSGLRTGVDRDSSVAIAARYGLGGPGIESWWRRDFPHPSRLALGPTQPPVQWVSGLYRG